MGEVAHAVTRQGMTLKTANALILALLQRYEHIFESPDVGVPFDQVYDLATVQPTEEWLRLYDDAKAEIRSLGLEGL